MIIYDLQCVNQHVFEGWFKNADDLEAQRASGMLTCPVCDSAEVHKKVTAARVGRKSNSDTGSNSKASSDAYSQAGGELATGDKQGDLKAPSYEQLQKMLGEVHKYVDTNFTDVGNKFAKEALKIHHGEKDAANIRGTVSKSELKELAEEGVTALPLPPRPVDKDKLN